MTLPQDDQGLIIPWDDSGNGSDFQLPETYELDDIPMITFDDLPGEAMEINLDPWITLDPAPQQEVPQIMYTDPMLPQNQHLASPNTASQDVQFTQTLNVDPFETPLPLAPAAQQSIPQEAPVISIQEPIMEQSTASPTIPPNIPPMTTTQAPITQQTPNTPVEENDDDISLSFLEEALDTPAEIPAPQVSTEPVLDLSGNTQPAPKIEESINEQATTTTPDHKEVNTVAPRKILTRTSIFNKAIDEMSERKEEIATIKTGKQAEISSREDHIHSLQEQIKDLQKEISDLQWEIADLDTEDQSMTEDMKALEKMKNLEQVQTNIAKGNITQNLKKAVEAEKASKTTKK